MLGVDRKYQRNPCLVASVLDSGATAHMVMRLIFSKCRRPNNQKILFRSKIENAEPMPPLVSDFELFNTDFGRKI